MTNGEEGIMSLDYFNQDFLQGEIPGQQLASIMLFEQES